MAPGRFPRPAGRAAHRPPRGARGGLPAKVAPQEPLATAAAPPRAPRLRPACPAGEPPPLELPEAALSEEPTHARLQGATAQEMAGSTLPPLDASGAEPPGPGILPCAAALLGLLGTPGAVAFAARAHPAWPHGADEEQTPERT
ncbi:unnamed protein product [Prorocentrum cordatum]|uniref:Skin secretory protein xP2-like n=1 Tax=Prorocentrum cordatum TaxID=2364126 RepID=A0ABN9VA02_9DINO|nr:unnamed protein product [Polarella glacialis]